jgi:predicted site-specific integrase-resolvase
VLSTWKSSPVRKATPGQRSSNSYNSAREQHQAFPATYLKIEDLPRRRGFPHAAGCRTPPIAGLASGKARESGARSYRFQGNFSSLFLNRQAVTSAIYARVSSDGQDYEDQLAELRAFVQRQGWTCVEYLEKLSGKEGNTRPALEQLLRDAQNKRFDVVVVWKLDRFGRSTLDTLTNIKTLSAYGVRFLVSTQPAIDTDDRSPLGKFILQILASVAELERGFIIERTQTGFKSYRASYAAGRVGNTRHFRRAP